MRLVLFVALLFSSAIVRAQEPTGPRSQAIRAVERGFHFQTDLGVAGVVDGFSSANDYGLGALLQLNAGVDIGSAFSVGAGGLFMTSSSSAPGDDLVLAGPTGRLQLAVLTSERDFLWVRVEGGYVFATDADFESPVFGAAATFEHFSKLRHFSLGVSAGAHVFTREPVGVSLFVSPLVKYTF